MVSTVLEGEQHQDEASTGQGQECDRWLRWPNCQDDQHERNPADAARELLQGRLC